MSSWGYYSSKVVAIGILAGLIATCFIIFSPQSDPKITIARRLTLVPVGIWAGFLVAVIVMILLAIPGTIILLITG
jgi:hypothetical protein